jgi:O-antigen/teichoic acid export membrane protein
MPAEARPIDAPEVPEPDAIVAGAEPSLRTRAAQGTVINAAFAVFLQTIGLLKGFVIAAFLTRSEYGVWGVLVITLGTLGWLKEIGISDKYVQQDAEDQELAYQRAFTIDLLSNGALFLLILVMLPVFALAYGKWEIVVPGLIIASTLPGQSLKTPTWIFYRQMRYFRQRVLDSVDPLVSFAVTIGLAVAGAGYWALVIGFAAGVYAGAIAAVLMTPYRLKLRWDRKTGREYFNFSWPVFVASASGMMIPQVSMLVATRKLGLAGAGVLGLAGTVSVYTNKIDELVTWTLYPAICRVKDKTELLFEAFVKSNRLALMWGVPFGVGIALFASDLVHFGLGDRWEPAITILQIFGLVAAVNHIGFNWMAFYSARGNTRPMAYFGPVVLLAFVVFAVPLLLLYGLNGFGAGMAAMTVVGLAMRAYYLTKLFPGFRMVGHAFRAIAPSIPAALITLGVRALAPDRTLGWAIAELALYLAITLAATWAFERDLLREAFGYVRGRQRPRTAPA